jgi:hypothetical protein
VLLHPYFSTGSARAGYIQCDPLPWPRSHCCRDRCASLIRHWSPFSIWMGPSTAQMVRIRDTEQARATRRTHHQSGDILRFIVGVRIRDIVLGCQGVGSMSFIANHPCVDHESHW